MKLYAILLVIVLCLPFHAQAESAKELSPFEQGKIFFQHQNYEKAYLAFYQAFMNDPTDLNISFFLGRSAFEHAMIARALGDKETSQKRLEAALMAFDRVLIVQPGAIRVKLEMARCHMELGSLELAKHFFYEVLDSNPPQSVKDNVQLLLAAIASTEKLHYFSGMASFGISFDDNVRSAPPPGTITYFYTLPLSTDPPVRDQIFATTVAANHVYKIPDTPYAWKTSALLYNNSYKDFRDLDLNMVGISTGPVYQKDRFMIDASVHLNDITLGWDEYVRPFGIGTSITYLLNPSFIISSALTIEKKGYAKESDDPKDATNLLLTLSPSLILDDNRFTVSFAKEHEKASALFWSYDKFSLGLRYDRVLPDNLTGFISFDLKKTKYGAINTDLTDTIIRSDTVCLYSIGLTKIFWRSDDKSQNLALQLTHTTTNANSNITRSNYKKRVYASQISYSF